ncbi:hypothetical protein RDABS01_029993 [Bienertia sinuspersici]
MYTTKSGYWLGRLGHVSGWAQRIGGTDDATWRAIWNLGGPPKVSHFLWRACTGLRERLNKGELLRCVTMAWACWSFRNSAVFANPWGDLQKGVMGFLRLVEDYGHYSRAVFTHLEQPAAPSRTAWCVPTAGNVKINVDAAVFNGGGVGLGAVVRSETGSVLAVVVQRRMARWKADMADALATRFGLSIARRLGYTRVELESDALSAVKAIHLGSFGRTPKDLVLEDAYVTSLLFDYFSCNHIKRAGNVVAHFAARLPPSNGEECLTLSPKVF